MGSAVDREGTGAEVRSEAFEALSTELHGLIHAEGYSAARQRLLEDREAISHRLSPEELTELVETTFDPDRHGKYQETIRSKGLVLAAYATEYFTTFGTYSSVTEESKEERRAAAFAMQSKALEYAFA